MPVSAQKEVRDTVSETSGRGISHMVAENLVALLSVVLWRAERSNELCDLGLQDLQAVFKVPPDFFLLLK